jgi:hypothetical protein
MAGKPVHISVVFFCKKPGKSFRILGISRCWGEAYDVKSDFKGLIADRLLGVCHESRLPLKNTPLARIF